MICRHFRIGFYAGILIMGGRDAKLNIHANIFVFAERLEGVVFQSEVRVSLVDLLRRPIKLKMLGFMLQAVQTGFEWLGLRLDTLYQALHIANFLPKRFLALFL